MGSNFKSDVKAFSLDHGKLPFEEYRSLEHYFV